MSSEFRPKTLVVIPVYRDDRTALKLLTRFTKKFVDTICLVVDGTSEVGSNAQYSTPAVIPLQVFRNRGRKGIGNAIKQGIRYGMENGYEFIVIMAGNNKDDPAEIPRVLEPVTKGDYDYVQGSRFLPGGIRVNNPFFRGVFSRLYPFVWTMFTAVRCTDVTNGFRAYKLKIFADPQINIWQKWLDGYELEYYIHYKVLTLGYKFKEVPVSKTYSHKHKGGYSQISPLKDWWRIVGPLLYLKLKVKK
jgi:dolichol-phosphate mannosyltransferase